MVGVAELETLVGRLEAVTREVSARMEPRYAQAVGDFPDPVGTMFEFEHSIGRFAAFVAHGYRAQNLSAEDQETMGRIHFDYVWPYTSGYFGRAYAAWNIVRSGLEGGRREFLNKVFEACVAWQRDITAKGLTMVFLGEYQKLDLKERVVISDAYFARYGHLLAAEIVSRDRNARTLDFERLIAKHAALNARLRDAGRRV